MWLRKCCPGTQNLQGWKFKGIMEAPLTTLIFCWKSVTMRGLFQNPFWFFLFQMWIWVIFCVPRFGPNRRCWQLLLAVSINECVSVSHFCSCQFCLYFCKCEWRMTASYGVCEWVVDSIVSPFEIHESAVLRLRCWCKTCLGKESLDVEWFTCLSC